jgi:hypothetical protein
LQSILNTVPFRTGINAHVWWNVNQRELTFQSEVWLDWVFWGLWMSGQDMQHCKSCSSFHDLWPTWKVEATSGLLIYSWKH